MRFSQTIVFIIFMFMTSAWAAGAHHPTNSPAGVQESGKALDQVRQQQSKGQTEVKRLERDVNRQQSDSDKANKRLQHQDEAIAKLRKQLQESKARSSAGQH